MRTLFWILLLGNAALFAVMQRGGPGWGEQLYQVQPALHEDKIRLLDAPQSTPFKALPDAAIAAAPPAGVPAQMAVSAPVPVVSPVPAAAPPKEAKSALVVKPVPPANPVPVAMPAPAAIPAPAANHASADAKRNNLICLEWGDFSGDDLKRATEVLSAMKLGDKLSQRQIEYDKGYWVYIPPLKNKAAVNRKISQLKVRGVNEYFVVWDAGPLQYAISLGVFKTQDAAQNYLKELRVKDVRTALVGERASKLKTTMFMLTKVDALAEAKLTEMKKDFPVGELKNIPCTLTR